MMEPFKNTRFADRLIAWQRRHGRHDLPWQQRMPSGGRCPYRVWISEIMLQQTQVDTVLRYYDRFLARFSNIESLAGADFDEVAALWSGLGYYARVRNLHRAARMIVETFGGRFPTSPPELEKLPGVGKSTASAIALFSFGVKAAILDGNVKRVLCRHGAIDKPLDRASTVKALWERAESLLPDRHIDRYSQGLMDLGSLICTRRKPDCFACPVHADCQASTQGVPEAYPVKAAVRPKPVKKIALIVVRRDSRLLFERRPDKGIWGGLWCFPEISTESSVSDVEVISIAADRYHATVKQIDRLEPIAHELTHFHLEIHPLLCFGEIDTVSAEEKQRWLTLSEKNTVGMPKPVLDLWHRIG